MTDITETDIKEFENRPIDDIIGDPRAAYAGLVAFQESVQAVLSSPDQDLPTLYPDKWIAINNGQVQVFADTMDGILNAIDRRGIPRADTLIRFITKEPRKFIL